MFKGLKFAECFPQSQSLHMHCSKSSVSPKSSGSYNFIEDRASEGTELLDGCVLPLLIGRQVSWAVLVQLLVSFTVLFKQACQVALGPIKCRLAHNTGIKWEILKIIISITNCVYNYRTGQVYTVYMSLLKLIGSVRKVFNLYFDKKMSNDHPERFTNA